MASPTRRATSTPRKKSRSSSSSSRRSSSRNATRATRNAAAVLFADIGKPRNINTVAVDAQPCVRRWLAADEATRVRVVAELATALDAMRAQPVWHDIKSSAWNIKYEFTQMVALGKAIDRLIRARLPLDEATLVKLARTACERSDLSVLRLTAQLEHYGASQVVGPDLRTAMLAMIERFGWSDYDAMRARLAWLAAPAQPGRIAQGRR